MISSVYLPPSYQFLDVFASVQRFVAIGESFSGVASIGLKVYLHASPPMHLHRPCRQMALRTKAKAYLAQFHRERLDELRMRLETETWRPMPLQVLAAALLTHSSSPPPMRLLFGAHFWHL